MGEVCTPGYPFWLVCGVASAAWISGALFGWSLREVRLLVPARLASRRRGGSRARRGAGFDEAIRARRSGYFLSEETRSWGDNRWTRTVGWALLTLIIVALTVSLVVTALTYRPQPSPVASTHEL